MRTGDLLSSKNEKSTITITLPVFEEPEIVEKFLENNKETLEKHPIIVVDRKGGRILKDRALFYKKTSCPKIGMLLGSSRKFLINRVQTEFTLNLDTDIVLPTNFIGEALMKLKDPQVAAVALDYEKSQDHLAFGPSIWKTQILKKLYDWEYLKTTKCECIYMWEKLNNEGYKVEGLTMKAKHLKSFGDTLVIKKGGFYNCAWKNVMRILGYTKFNILSKVTK